MKTRTIIELAAGGITLIGGVVLCGVAYVKGVEAGCKAAQITGFKEEHINMWEKESLLNKQTLRIVEGSHAKNLLEFLNFLASKGVDLKKEYPELCAELEKIQGEK